MLLNFSIWFKSIVFGTKKAKEYLGKSPKISTFVIVTKQDTSFLSYVKRFNSYETIGGLFAQVTSGTMELSIVEKIWLLIIEVVTAIAEQVSADYDELMESAINGNKHLKVLFEPDLMEKQIA